MASKYDAYWRSELDRISDAVRRAILLSEDQHLDVTPIRQFGDRSSWYGTVTVSGGQLHGAQMAHARSLGQVLIDAGVAEQWPSSIRLHISPQCVLTVGATTSTSQVRNTTGGEQLDSSTRLRPHASPPPDANEACEQIHDLLKALPKLTSPSDVNFSNGLYFFYEDGETSGHDPHGRIVRIGNHPKAQDRLVGRLRDHYRTSLNAKNGSVFRRYLGGALLRRARPNHPCLEPRPGGGHWESQDARECGGCASVEEQVTEHLNTRMWFRVVRIDDQELRNTLEKQLIATVARCGTCQPSDGWLGQFCYQSDVQQSGLWNEQHVAGATITRANLAAFENLARISPLVRSSIRSRRSQHPTDLSDTLLIIPCCSSKKGKALHDRPMVGTIDLLPDSAREILIEGRTQAFQRPGTRIDRNSPRIPALDLYTGQPYATSRFRELLVNALDLGLHCLILSGGYGLVRPEEPIHDYGAHLAQHTRSVWGPRLRHLLPAYVQHNQIRRAFISVSNTYASVLPRGFAPNERWAIPTFDRAVDRGSAMRVVPAKVGRRVTELLASGFHPGDDWELTRG